MSVTYIGRNRILQGNPDEPLAQLVNVPELQGTQRCQFCHYFQSGRTFDDYEACQRSNRCGDESLLYAVLNNIYAAHPILSRDFTPTQLFRQRAIEYVPRYLQYFTADIPGYQCNHLCQFYPNRIANEETIATCSNTNACGRNGSFFNLLTLKDKRTLSLTDFQTDFYSPSDIPLFNGDVIQGVTVEDFDVDAGQTARLLLSDGSSRVVLCFIPDSPLAGNILRFLQTTTSVFCFERLGIASESIHDDCIVILSSDDYVATWLANHVTLDDLFYSPLTNLRLLSWASSRQGWFTTYPDFIDFVAIDNGWLVVFNSVDYRYRMAVRFLTSDGQVLMSDRKVFDPKAWRRLKTASTIPGDISFVTLTSYNGSWAAWLKACGVRDTVLKVLP